MGLSSRWVTEYTFSSSVSPYQLAALAQRMADSGLTRDGDDFLGLGKTAVAVNGEPPRSIVVFYENPMIEAFGETRPPFIAQRFGSVREWAEGQCNPRGAVQVAAHVLEIAESDVRATVFDEAEARKRGFALPSWMR
jgi:hypothetical protein